MFYVSENPHLHIRYTTLLSEVAVPAAIWPPCDVSRSIIFKINQLFNHHCHIWQCFYE